jgi:hypothetical protein
MAYDDYKQVDHVAQVPMDNALTDAQGTKLYREGILKVLESQPAFSAATQEGQKLAVGYPYLQNAPCAFSTSAALRYAAKLTDTPNLREVITLVASNNERIHTCTNEVEVSMRRLGFNYFDKDLYVAPMGAIGLLNDRSPNSSCHGVSQTKSGHIYFIMEDRGGRGFKDLITDNFVRFKIIYKAPGSDSGTDGFWLPPGVVPARRDAAHR